MTKSRAILTAPLLTSLLALAFCLWTALGNDINICVTTGCSLYQDFSVFGISLWWYGTGAFFLLAVCSLLGLSTFGRRLAALFLFGDAALLFLMMLTAPCVNCLVVALLFCAAYLFFRGYDTRSLQKHDGEGLSRPILVWCWLFLFVANLGAVARSQMEIWPILDESGEGRARMFFSPSCHFCREGIDQLSGKVYMAFYPVADNDTDIYRIAKMRDLLNQGLNISEALAQSADFAVPGFFSCLKPDMLLLRLRLLVNKAHVFSAGSQGVPFFEYLGLPPDMKKQIDGMAGNTARTDSASGPLNTGKNGDLRDSSLPIEMGGQCGGQIPCPPAN